MKNWSDMINERDSAGDLTPLALALDAISDLGCDCGTDEPGTCIACHCEAGLKDLWERLVMPTPVVREALADAQHEIWSHWMRYLFSQCVPDDHPGDLCIPSRLVERWKRQTETPYKSLSEREKESDREQANKVLVVIRGQKMSERVLDKEYLEKTVRCSSLLAPPGDAVVGTIARSHLMVLEELERAKAIIEGYRLETARQEGREEVDG